LPTGEHQVFVSVLGGGVICFLNSCYLEDIFLEFLNIPH
jgi:hypothetical protein